MPAGADHSAVPEAYHDIGNVFSKQCGSMLPPHRPYDCAIDLLPNAPIPCSRLYSLSKPEQEVIERYLSSPWQLASSACHPSQSVQGSFRSRTRTGPCIDYRGLNDIKAKTRYPLPLLDSAFVPLQGTNLHQTVLEEC